uniref:Phosphatidylcholine transfer protein n=1 Tax=Geotrypetes seraphini TaxID=260995 RepID=A0A6P8SCE7_GEOSA|nr:phosphatidylcholine transfer protein isoform X1 [Geotrypetes seraphini]
MELSFPERLFRESWGELEAPALDGGWELFMESTGFTVYRLYDQQSGLYEYKVFGGLSDCPPQLCVDVYMDLEYRKQWDQYVKELYEEESERGKFIYWEVKYPFPLSNRDYVCVRECRDLDVAGEKVWVILAKSVTVPQCPEKPGIIRVSSYKQSVAIKSDGKNGSRVFMNYFDNPGGMIPSWLINWAAKSGVPSFLQEMQKACKKYPH